MSKRLFDITLALLILTAALPLLLATAAAVRASGLPVFYRQTRVGLHRRPITVLHFCTMRPGPETDDDGHRITRLGRILRKTAIDALPELLLVLRGHTSIVGPRLISLRDDARWSHLPGWADRFSVRPGLTGLAQLNAARDDWAVKLAWDLEYVARASLLLDFSIFVRSILCAVGHRFDGAEEAPIPGYHG